MKPRRLIGLVFLWLFSVLSVWGLVAVYLNRADEQLSAGTWSLLIASVVFSVLLALLGMRGHRFTFPLAIVVFILAIIGPMLPASGEPFKFYIAPINTAIYAVLLLLGGWLARPPKRSDVASPKTNI